MYKKPDKKDINMFAFLDPFSITVWIYTATLYLVISIVLFFISRWEYSIFFKIALRLWFQNDTRWLGEPSSLWGRTRGVREYVGHKKLYVVNPWLYYDTRMWYIAQVSVYFRKFRYISVSVIYSETFAIFLYFVLYNVSLKKP